MESRRVLLFFPPIPSQNEMNTSRMSYGVGCNVTRRSVWVECYVCYLLSAEREHVVLNKTKKGRIGQGYMWQPLSHVFAHTHKGVNDKNHKHAQETVQHNLFGDVIGTLVLLLF